MTSPIFASSSPVLSLEDAVVILQGFVANHADKGNEAAKAMVVAAQAALDDHRSRSSETPRILIEMSGGLINAVSATTAVDVVFFDEDTEGGDSDNVLDLPGGPVYVSHHVVSDQDVAEDALWLSSQLEAVDKHDAAEDGKAEVVFEWKYPDEDTGSTPAFVNLLTGVVTIPNRHELPEDHDDGNVVQRIVIDDEHLIDVEAFGRDGWRVPKDQLTALRSFFPTSE